MSRKCQPDLVVEVPRVLEPTMKVGPSQAEPLQVKLNLAKMKKEFVIKIPKISEKSRWKAMKLIAAQGGVDSVAKIEGEDKDHFFLRVTGDNIDIVTICDTVRRKVGHAEIISVDKGLKEVPLCAGFRLLADAGSARITAESLRRNAGCVLGMHGMTAEEAEAMVREGDLDGDGVLDETEFCVLMVRLSPGMMDDAEAWLGKAIERELSARNRSASASASASGSN